MDNKHFQLMTKFDDDVIKQKKNVKECNIRSVIKWTLDTYRALDDMERAKIISSEINDERSGIIDTILYNTRNKCTICGHK